jgi:hypothetical protein
VTEKIETEPVIIGTWVACALCGRKTLAFWSGSLDLPWTCTVCVEDLRNNNDEVLEPPDAKGDRS